MATLDPSTARDILRIVELINDGFAIAGEVRISYENLAAAVLEKKRRGLQFNTADAQAFLDRGQSALDSLQEKIDAKKERKSEEEVPPSDPED